MPMRREKCQEKYKLDFSAMGFDEQTSSEDEDDGSINSRSSGTEIFRSPFASTPPRCNPFDDSVGLSNDTTQIIKLGEDQEGVDCSSKTLMLRLHTCEDED